MHRLEAEALRVGPAARQRDLVSLQAVENGGLWVLARPGEVEGVTFSAQEWQALLRQRVGVKQGQALGQCPHCREAADDSGTTS